MILVWVVEVRRRRLRCAEQNLPLIGIVDCSNFEARRCWPSTAVAALVARRGRGGVVARRGGGDGNRLAIRVNVGRRGLRRDDDMNALMRAERRRGRRGRQRRRRRVRIVRF